MQSIGHWKHNEGGSYAAWWDSNCWRNHQSNKENESFYFCLQTYFRLLILEYKATCFIYTHNTLLIKSWCINEAKIKAIWEGNQQLETANVQITNDIKYCLGTLQCSPNRPKIRPIIAKSKFFKQLRSAFRCR